MFALQASTKSSYFEAIDYLDRLKKEGKCNEITLELCAILYAKELDILIKEGYFHPENN